MHQTYSQHLGCSPLLRVTGNDSTQLICGNFILFRLSTKQFLVPHIPFLDYAPLPSLWELSDTFTEPFFWGNALPTHGQLPVQFPSAGNAPYAVAHTATCRRSLSTNCRQLTTSGVPRNFFGGGGVQQIQLTQNRTGIWGAVAP